MEKNKVILDFDNTLGLSQKEIDDGLTLLYLLANPEIELLGVTATFGNGTIEEVWEATQQLAAFTKLSVPIWKGEGKRGQEPTEAASFLAQTAAAYPGDVVVVAIGPLGNLRTAAELDPGFFANLKGIVCMGGMLQPMRLGWRSMDELNFSADPEASLAVLNNDGCPVTVMNAHICLQAAFGYADLLRTLGWDKTIRKPLFLWLFLFGTYFGVFKFYLWDLLPAVYLTHPEWFKQRFVKVRSSLAEMEIGRLVVEDAPEGGVNMPEHILDRRAFRRHLFDNWRNYFHSRK